jgi:dTDP-4-dehydrorhamnose reductase
MKARTVLVTGSRGQVGLELSGLNWGDSVALLTPARDEFDIVDPGSIKSFLNAHPVDAIINCAAYTAVDRAEDEVVEAYAANGFGPARLAAEARRRDLPILHMSTDYVFGPGKGFRGEDDPVGPTSVYGASKLAGEMAVLAATDRAVILRTAWVVSAHRSNFLKTMLKLAARQSEIRVVSDQRGCPTAARDIAGALQTIMLRLLDDPDAPTGIFHFVNSGEATWAELAAAIMDEARARGLPAATIVPVASGEYPTKVKRPADSRLSAARLAGDYGIHPRPWRGAIAEIIEELAQEAQRVE